MLHASSLMSHLIGLMVVAAGRSCISCRIVVVPSFSRTGYGDRRPATRDSERATRERARSCRSRDTCTVLTAEMKQLLTVTNQPPAAARYTVCSISNSRPSTDRLSTHLCAFYGHNDILNNLEASFYLGKLSRAATREEK
jgi:hypothetical protein